MKTIWIIAKRELATFFDSLIAYIILGLFLGFSGFFTWLYGNDIFLVGQANLRVFFSIASWSLFFFIPARGEKNRNIGTFAYQVGIRPTIDSWKILRVGLVSLYSPIGDLTLCYNSFQYW